MGRHATVDITGLLSDEVLDLIDIEAKQLDKEAKYGRKHKVIG